jgi:carbamoyltransferase
MAGPGRNLCLAGGLGLNALLVSALESRSGFENVFVQPAAGNAGTAIGAVLHAWHVVYGQTKRASLGNLCLGPGFSAPEIKEAIENCKLRFHYMLTTDQVIDTAVGQLNDNKIVAWMHGRMEFGPRSLGTRSILGDARSPTMQKTLNLKVKYRESFRPFAPAVLREDVDKYFDIDTDSPYMLMVAPVKKERRRAMTAEEEKLFGIDKLNVPRSDIPAVTHIDYSGRIQTVHRETNPAFHDLISSFKAKTGCSVVVNTSFNVRGEPIVCTPEDAFRCFMGSEIEVLVVGNCFLRKEDQDPALKLDYKNAFELD